ncbi:MAG: flagellar export protein FliJ [Rhodoferax sp.]|nr:flagellar export protein FliJ [Rhodoferax sp.]
MSQPNAIELAIELATRKRDDAARGVAKVLRDLDFAHDQMAQLESYAADTDARLTSTTGGVLSAELIRHHYQFVERLQQAIQLQSRAIADAKAQVERARKVLLQTEVRLAGLKQVLEGRQAVVARTLLRREQRVTDEFAAMVYIRNRAQWAHGEAL